MRIPLSITLPDFLSFPPVFSAFYSFWIYFIRLYLLSHFTMPSWTWSRHLRPSSSSSSYLFSLLLIISTATEFTDATQCYHSDGTPTDASFQPCDPDAEFSACCATNKPDADICLSSGLCLAQQIGYSGLVFQNGCTDQSWSSSSCPRVCPGFG